MRKIIMSQKMWAAVLLILLAIAAGTVLAMGGIAVTAIPVTTQIVSDSITEKGIVETGIAVTQSAQVSGIVQEVCVKENQQVKAGDILLRIDTVDLSQERAVQQSVLNGYEAQLESCSNGYAAAEALYQKQQELYRLGGISKLELDNSEAAMLTAKAQMEQAQSSVNSQKQMIQQLDLALQRCIVTAAVDGIVAELPVKNTNMVQAGQAVVTLLGQQELMAVFDILSSEVPLLHVGDAVTLTAQLRSGDKSFDGVIVQINDFAQAGVSSLGLEEHRVKVTVAIDTEETTILKNGYEVQGSFQLYYQEDALAVPNSALYKVNDDWYVFTVQNGNAVETPVEIGYQAVTVTEILSGLTTNDVVIQNANTEGLQDGVRVKNNYR